MNAVHTAGRLRSALPPRRQASVVLLACLVPALLSGCFTDTQRFPGMLKPLSNPLPEGVKSTFLRGPEDAYVIRHSDPVSVRTAETTSTVRLTYYDKRTRTPAGSWVYSGPNGHVEVLLPGNTVITMRGPSAGVVGSESRREPAFTFIDVAHATVTFGELGIVQLPGGALLEAYGGPFVLELISDDILRVRNRSSQQGAIAYREELFSLSPSEVVDLALLQVGTAPFELDEASRDVLTEAGRVEIRGTVDVLSSGLSARLRASGDSEISGFGQTLRLDPGDEVLFEGLGSEAERQARNSPPSGTP
ncbi:hypothetical protein [Planctomycetes bacterium Poly30]